MKNDQPSSTAVVVARSIAAIAANRETAAFVVPEAARINALLLGSCSAGAARFLKRITSRWFQKVFRLYERLTIPNLALHQALRKLYIESAARQALAEGFEQIVVLGGGFDTLAPRLSREFPAVNFLELDHPATQSVKRAAIEKHNLGGENLRLLAADFTVASPSEILAACPNYDSKLKTIFICEGVTMYLEENDIRRIFSFIETRNAAVQRFIFTFMEPNEKGKIGFRRATFLARIWLKYKNEPFKWGLERNCLKDFLAARGFSLNALATAETLARIYLVQSGRDGLSIAEGENICVCETVVR